ncbi:MAG: hypothetical protein QXP46_00975 [Archaeoglobaceae archaeon]
MGLRCKDCLFWLRDFSLPENVGYCSAKGALCSKDEVCEMFRRRELEQVAIKVLHY